MVVLVTSSSPATVSWVLLGTALVQTVTWQRVVRCANPATYPGQCDLAVAAFGVADVAGTSPTRVRVSGLSPSLTYLWYGVPQSGAAVGLVGVYLGSGQMAGLYVSTSPAPPPPSPPPPPFDPLAPVVHALAVETTGAGAPTTSSVTLDVQVNQDAVVSYLVLPASSSAPLWQSVVTCGAGTCGVAGALAKGQLAVAANATTPLYLPGLSPATSYAVYAVPQAPSVAGKTTVYVGSGALYSLTFATLAPPPPPPPPFDPSAPTMVGLAADPTASSMTSAGVTFTTSAAATVSYLLAPAASAPSWQQAVDCATAGAAGLALSTCGVAGAVIADRVTAAPGVTTSLAFHGLSPSTAYEFVAVPQAGSAVGKTDVYAGSGADSVLLLTTAPAPPPPFDPSAPRAVFFAQSGATTDSVQAVIVLSADAVLSYALVPATTALTCQQASGGTRLSSFLSLPSSALPLPFIHAHSPPLSMPAPAHQSSPPLPSPLPPRWSTAHPSPIPAPPSPPAPSQASWLPGRPPR